MTDKNFNADFIRTSEFFAMNQTQGNINSIQPHVTLRKKDFEEAGIMMMRASQTSFRRTESNMFDDRPQSSAAKVDPMA